MEGKSWLEEFEDWQEQADKAVNDFCKATGIPRWLVGAVGRLANMLERMKIK